MIMDSSSVPIRAETARRGNVRTRYDFEFRFHFECCACAYVLNVFFVNG